MRGAYLTLKIHNALEMLLPLRHEVVCVSAIFSWKIEKKIQAVFLPLCSV